MKKITLPLILIFFAGFCLSAAEKPMTVREMVKQIKTTKSQKEKTALLERIRKVNPNKKDNLRDLLEANKEKYEQDGVVDAARGVYIEFYNKKLLPVLQKYLKNGNPKVVFGSIIFLEILNREYMLNARDCEDILIRILDKYYSKMNDILKTKNANPAGNKVDTDEKMISYSIYWSAATSMKILGDLGTEKSAKAIEKYVLLEENSELDGYLRDSLFALDKRGVKNLASSLERGPGSDESWKYFKKKYRETH